MEPGDALFIYTVDREPVGSFEHNIHKLSYVLPCIL